MFYKTNKAIQAESMIQPSNNGPFSTKVLNYKNTYRYTFYISDSYYTVHTTTLFSTRIEQRDGPKYRYFLFDARYFWIDFQSAFNVGLSNDS